MNVLLYQIWSINLEIFRMIGGHLLSNNKSAFMQRFLRHKLMNPLCGHPCEVCLEIIRMHEFLFDAHYGYLEIFKGIGVFLFLNIMHDASHYLSQIRLRSHDRTAR